MRSKKKQSGAVLIVGLVLVLVLSIIVLSATQSTILQQKMSINMRDKDLAFQAAESALNSGESYISSSTIDGLAGIFDDTDGLYTFEVNRQLYNTVDWDNLDKRESTELHQLKNRPVYIIEELSNIEAAGNSLQVPKQLSGEYYRVTSKSEGGTDASIVVLQSMYKK